MSTPREELPLAVRYRPTRFSEVVGQAATVSILRGMITRNSLPGTITLHGPFSCGKTTLARLIALYVNCTSLVKGEPCGKCPSCKAMRGVILGNGSHPDVHEMDAASQRGIDDVRSLKRLAELSPVSGRRRIFILDECHAYTSEAWQSALKLFEFPPGKSMFILCTTEVSKLPSTIRSRAKMLGLDPIKFEDSKAFIQKIVEAEGYTKLVGKKLRSQIAQVADGHPRDALSVLSSVFDYINSKKGISRMNLLKMFPLIVNQTVELKGYLAAQDFVNAILAGQYLPAFTAILVADNYVSFISTAIGMMRLKIESTIDYKLVDPQRKWLLGKLKGGNQNVDRGFLHEYGDMLSLLVEAQQKIKAFNCDAVALLEATALECIAISHGILTSKTGGKSKASKPKRS